MSGWADPHSPANDLSDGLDEKERRSRRMQFAIALLVLVASLIALAYRIRGHRHLTQLKSEIRSHTRPTAEPVHVDLRPGGQDPVILNRSALPGSTVPEFLSVTLLPGRGLNIFQITAAIPNVGEIPLLDSPSLEDAVKSMSGSGPDRNGAVTANLGAAFTLPWAGRIPGSTTDANAVTQWNGRTLSLPAIATDRGPMAVPGLMLASASTSIHHDAMPDGALDQATFNLGNFGGSWPSQTQATVSVMLSGRSMDLTVTARNAGTIAEPIGIGWQPRFLLDTNRNLVRLRLPGGERVEERATGQPTGKFLPVQGTVYDFTARNGVALGDRGIDASFVRLRSDVLDNGPAADLILPGRGYALRVVGLSSNIRSFRIYAPAGGHFLSIQPNLNYDDPFGAEWPHGEDTGMVVLEPGQTVQWMVRLEILPPSAASAQPAPPTPFDPPR